MMRIALFIILVHLLLSHADEENCQTDDCRGGDCEVVRLSNGSTKKSCHCVKGVCGDACQRLCNASSQCDANPCWAGGTCVDVANVDYVCLCPPNHTGKDCRTLLACQTDSCFNGGTCVQTAYGARCNCPENAKGDFCQYKIPMPRNNNMQSYADISQVGYRQFDAETLAVIAGLGSSSSSNNADSNAHRSASSNSGSVAVTNQSRSQFVFCLTNPCENGGTCFVTNTATTKGICVCRGGFAGDYCENLFNNSTGASSGISIRTSYGYCASNPCLNDGSCVEIGTLQGYCRCSVEYRGAYCEISVRSFGCNPNPCKNGGTCVLLQNNQAQCLCTPVFRGLNCNQFSYVPCGEATCHGTQGVCVANQCICKVGYAGPRCDSTDFCSDSPCLNGGTCIRTNEEPYGGCSCPREFSGPTCSNDPCNPSPCLNGGHCMRKPDNQFYCQCRNRNKGVYCEQVECFPSDATVDVLNVGKVSLSSLKVGSRVRVVDDQNQLTYSPVIAFLHREANEQALYKRIQTLNTLIELSGRHLIHRRKDGFVWAEKLVQGDEVLVLSPTNINQTQWEKITKISDVNKKGLMAPLTEEGTLLVNNVHASCYAIVKSHKVGHFALAPYRFYRRLFGRMLDTTTETSPILAYANTLLQFFKNLPIAKDLIF